jgi:hypothetical protein
MNGMLIFLQIASLEFAIQVNDGGEPRSGLSIWVDLLVGQQVALLTFSYRFLNAVSPGDKIYFRESYLRSNRAPFPLSGMVRANLFWLTSVTPEIVTPSSRAISSRGDQP